MLKCARGSKLKSFQSKAVYTAGEGTFDCLKIGGKFNHFDFACKDQATSIYDDINSENESELILIGYQLRTNCTCIF